MMKTKFVVYGEPQGKARPRFTRYGRTYTPKKTVDYEQKIREAYQAAGGSMSEYPVTVSIIAHYNIPKSVSKAKAQMMIGDELLPCKKPDLDNIAKCVCDALNGIAYKDDTQVCNLIAQKRYRKEPAIIVTVSEVIP